MAFQAALPKAHANWLYGARVHCSNRRHAECDLLRTSRLRVTAAFLPKSLPGPEIWNGNLPVELYQPAQFEVVEDSIGPAYTVSVPIRGGASVLKAQSACGFRHLPSSV